MKWSVYHDEFLFDIEFEKDFNFTALTRRLMLKFVAATFDPSGLISPWIVKGKLLFQKATLQALDWDEEIPCDLKDDWMQWLADLRCHSLCFPRALIVEKHNDAYYEYHVFCDASMSAYGACVYLRCVNSFGHVSSNLVIAKGHVAPTKQLTIPRLELQAALKAVQLAALVKRAMALSSVPTFFWTDSMIVLGYIKNQSRRFRTFVANRVGVIRSLSSADDWHHVSSEENPADLITKYQPQGSCNDLWKHAWATVVEPSQPSMDFHRFW